VIIDQRQALCAATAQLDQLSKTLWESRESQDVHVHRARLQEILLLLHALIHEVNGAHESDH
jgi:hypothetical protein